MDYGENTHDPCHLRPANQRLNVVHFIDDLLAANDGRPTEIVLDKVSVDHGIDEAIRNLYTNY
ncbi:hypothetical protein BSLA_01r4985 [Burkholderia stabilis]|nr:hypothetical protein BSLA_01r4985 [Burkholderia stabilis]